MPANERIYDSMIQKLMQGEMKDWNDEVPIGEVHHIQLLVKVIEKVDDTYHSIKNIKG